MIPGTNAIAVLQQPRLIRLIYREECYFILAALFDLAIMPMLCLSFKAFIWVPHQRAKRSWKESGEMGPGQNLSKFRLKMFTS